MKYSKNLYSCFAIEGWFVHFSILMATVCSKETLSRKPMRSKVEPLLLALLIQVGLLLIAVFVVVLVPEFKSQPEFVAKKKIYLPQKQLEHKVALAEFQNAASSPMQMDRIRTSALLPDALPSLPLLPKNAFNPIERSSALLQSDALLGQSGALGALNGLSNQASSASLFGIEDSGQRIVILFDNSTTVWTKASAAGVSTTVFVSELSKLIDGLNANTLFGLVPFSRKVGTFRDYLIAAGSRNKNIGKSWIAANVRSTRKSTKLGYSVDGIEGAFTVAFQLEPEIIFVISDGDFQRNALGGVSGGNVPWEDLAKTVRQLTREYGIEPRIHFIGFRTESESAQELEKLSRRYKGKFRDFQSR